MKHLKLFKESNNESDSFRSVTVDEYEDHLIKFSIIQRDLTGAILDDKDYTFSEGEEKIIKNVINKKNEQLSDKYLLRINVGSMNLYRQGVGAYKNCSRTITINKCKDQWFIILDRSMINGNRIEHFYICDQRDGLKKCIESEVFKNF